MKVNEKKRKLAVVRIVKAGINGGLGWALIADDLVTAGLTLKGGGEFTKTSAYQVAHAAGLLVKKKRVVTRVAVKTPIITTTTNEWLVNQVVGAPLSSTRHPT